MKPIAFLIPLFTAGALMHANDIPIDKFIESKLKEYKVPGAVVVIVEEGEMPYVQGFGVADISTNQKVNGDTRFQLASVSKTFTGALFGIAMDKEEIKLEQPIKDVFPQFQLNDAYATKWATVPDLLSHRSGLPAFGGGLLEMLGYNASEILQKIPEIKPESSFRDHSAYSNIGYFLAGEATARAARQPWISLIKTRILAPLHMAETGLASEIMTGSANVAKPYLKTPDDEIIPTKPNYQPILQPAGALASTGNDIAKYLQMWLSEGHGPGGPVISKKSVEELLTPIIAEDPGFAELPPISKRSGFDYTIGGWGEYHFQNHRVFEKGGALEGYRSLVVLVPDKKWGVAILTNLNLNVLPESIRAELLERLLGRSGENFQAAILKRSRSIDKLLLPPAPPVEAKPPTMPLSAFAGTYVNEHYGRWEVSETEGALSIKAGPAKLEGRLTSWDANDMLVTWPSLANAGKGVAKFQKSNDQITGFSFEKQDFHRVGR